MRWIEGADQGLLLVCDHASNAVPPGIDLGIDPALLHTHIALDIGAAALTEAVAARLGCPAWLATASRLVVDVNRPPELAIPEASDGIAIPGNRDLSSAGRAARLALHSAFHAGLAARVAAAHPMLVSIHSFTPALATDPSPRPWPIAILWNRDSRGADIALAHLKARADLGGPVGANQPYSGRVLNYTMDRHAEANGLVYLGFEIRQDLIGEAAGVARWAAIVADTIRDTRAALSC
ncbi:MAG: N-formylglutamate amidohydrolase [Sphingomonadaceae bacterium]